MKSFDEQQSANFADSSKQLPLHNFPASSLSLYASKSQPSASGSYAYTRKNNEKRKNSPKVYQKQTLFNDFEKTSEEIKYHAFMLTLSMKKLNRHFLKLYRKNTLVGT